MLKTDVKLPDPEKLNQWTCLAIILTACTLLPAGCGRSRSTSGKVLSEQAAAAFIEGRFDRSAQLYARAASTLPVNAGKMEAGYWAAASLLEAGQYTAAEKRTQSLLRKIHSPGLRARTLQLQAMIARKQGNAVKAERIYAELRQKYRTWINDAEILAAMIACRRDSGRNADDLVHSLRLAPGAALYQQTRSPVTHPAPVYAVQVGAFSNPDTARSLCNRVRAAGIECTVIRRKIAGRILHVVQAGAFRSRQKALKRMRMLGQKGFISSIRRISTR